MQQSSALHGVHVPPGRSVEGLSRGFDGEVDIFSLSFLDRDDVLSRGGVRDAELQASFGSDEFVVDEESCACNRRTSAGPVICGLQMVFTSDCKTEL